MADRKGGPRCQQCGGRGKEKSAGDPDALGKLERVTLGRVVVKVHVGPCKAAAVQAEIDKWKGGAAAGQVRP